MDERIASLTVDQASHALIDFFEQLPAEAFAGGKPSLTDLADVTERTVEEAPPELTSLLQAVLESGDADKRGEFAKQVLDRFNQEPGLQPYLDNALRAENCRRLLSPLADERADKG
jgi:hypothetical protein